MCRETDSLKTYVLKHLGVLDGDSAMTVLKHQSGKEVLGPRDRGGIQFRDQAGREILS